MTLFLTIAGVLLLIIVFGFIAYYFRTQPQLKPDLSREPARDQITAMVRDPHWIFTYWELPDKTKQTVQNDNGSLTLRVYELADDKQDIVAAKHFDIPVSLDTESWHIKNLRAGQTYLLEIGEILANGAFKAFARSRKVNTPYDQPGEIDPAWMPSPNAWESYGSLTSTGYGKASEYMAERND